MNWVRKGVVVFFSAVLLLSLLGSVAAVNIHLKLSKPKQIETWLAETKIYDKFVNSQLDQAQDESTKNGGATSVALNNPAVQQAAKQVFTASLIQDSANKFIEGNYAWLNGDSKKPEFTIDLTQAKQDFADNVGKAVTAHLASLPACTPDQLTKLQIPIDPLSVTCRPNTLDPKAEGNRVAAEISDSNDFLSSPKVTADTFNQNQNSTAQPYYQKLSWLPDAYKTINMLPLILGLVGLLSIVAIIFIHPTRRKGIRRVAYTFSLAGAILVATKFLTDMITNKLSDLLIKNSKGATTQPLNDFLHKVVAQLSQAEMLFGIIFIVIGVVIFVILLATREGKERQPKRQKAPVKSNSSTKKPSFLDDEEEEDDEESDYAPAPPKPIHSASDLSGRLRTQPRPTGPPPLSGSPKPLQPLTPKPATQLVPAATPSQPRPPKRPRLIQ